MEIIDNYKKKYIKYKLKYIQLRNQLAGAALAYQSNSDNDSDNDSGYDSEYYYYSEGEEDENIEEIKNYCKELDLIEENIKNKKLQIEENDKQIIGLKQNIATLSFTNLNSHEIIKESKESKSQLEINIALLEDESDKRLMNEQLLKINQDIEYHESLIIDSQKSLLDEETKSKKISEINNKLNQEISLLNQEYQTQFSKCQEELLQLREITDNLDRFESKIESFKKLTWREKKQLEFMISKIKDNDLRKYSQDKIKELNKRGRSKR